MSGFLAILIGAALVNNVALAHLSGLEPALRTRARLGDAARLALAIGCLLMIATIACWPIERYLLTPFGLDWLRIPLWLLLVAALAPWPRVLLRAGADADTRRVLSPPLLIGNGLVLGTLVLNAQDDVAPMLARGFGMASGFAIVLLLFTAMHDRLDGTDVPAPFRGAPILLITAAMMALAFMGFAGLGR